MDPTVIRALVTVGIVFVGVTLHRTNRGFARAFGRRQPGATRDPERNKGS